MADPVELPVRLGLLEHRQDRTEDAINRLVSSMDDIRNFLGQLVRLQEQHIQHKEALTRAFGDINDLETDVRKIQLEMPVLKLVKRWVLVTVFGFATLTVGLIWTNFQSTRHFERVVHYDTHLGTDDATGH